MRRFEQNHPSIFDALGTGRQPSPEPLPQPARPPPAPRRPPMVRRAKTARRGTTWGAAAALLLAGGCGLSLLWSGAPATGMSEAPAPRVVQVVPAVRWTPETDAPRLAFTAAPPPVPQDVVLVPPPAAAARPETVAVEPAVAVAAAEGAWQPPVKTESTQPAYPEAAREAGLTGTVVAEAAIDAAGAVTATRIVRGAAPELDQAARDALALWRFEPATHGGQPVPSSYRVAFDFELEPAAAPVSAPEPTLAANALLPPVKLFTPPPQYPPADWLAAVEGDVTLKAEVDERGQVTAVEVLEAPSPGLGEAAVRALERWRFRPATQDGEPVAAHHLQTFRFTR